MLNELNLTEIKKYCGLNQYTKWVNHLTKRKYSSCVRIVNTGIVSSGKSSIFNALLNHIDNEKFPTGAARTTVAADECVYNEKMILIDTPGIDVRLEDDKIAYNMVISADIVLLIHNVKDGDLKRSEVEWIENICSIVGKEELFRKLVFIGSWIDERDRDHDYPKLIDNLKSQLYSILGHEVPFFEVSAKRYIKGMKTSKPGLVSKSNINELRTYLEKHGEELLSKKNQELDEEYGNLRSSTRVILEREKNARTKLLKNTRTMIEQRYSTAKNTWYSTLETFKMLNSRVRTLKSELNRI